MMKFDHSPITLHHFDSLPFFLKRDDQLHPHFSGNKARKLRFLLEQDHPNITTLISYGSAQSNTLYSLAALAQLKGWRCEFYVDRIAPWLQQHPNGNYQAALALGAHIYDVSSLSSSAISAADYIQQQRQPGADCFVIEEGGRHPNAEYGVQQLGNEILAWASSQWQDFHRRELVVALPAGTGTTALYLHKTLKPHGISVLTCPCVGGADYLTQQFHALGEHDHPTILTLDHKHHFGRLYLEDYRIWQALYAQTGVEFDLLYDPMMWRCLRHWRQTHPNKTLCYIHQGGILGNRTMLPRYQRKFG